MQISSKQVSEGLIDTHKISNSNVLRNLMAQTRKREGIRDSLMSHQISTRVLIRTVTMEEIIMKHLVSLAVAAKKGQELAMIGHLIDEYS